MKEIYLNDLRGNDTFKSEYFGVADIHKGTDKTGRPYWDLTLVDNSGQLKAKIWSDVLQKIGGQNLDQIVSGSLISCSGSVGEFRGVLQIAISELEVVDEKALDFDMASIFPSSKISPADLAAGLETQIKTVKNPFLAKVVTKFYQQWHDQILTAPAAKTNHHNFRGGLAEHLLEMFHLAETITHDYPEANADLITTGIFFHDIGKLQELEFNNFAINYTLPGKLIGHICLGLLLLDQSVYQLFPKLSSEQRLLYTQLQHIVLSHHFQLDWGSPVTPKSIEAVIVSKIDDLSSKAQLFRRIRNEYQNSELDFTPYLNGVNGEVFLNNSNLENQSTADSGDLQSEIEQPMIL